MKRGELTVFLSLVFVLLLSFVSGILEVAVIHTSKNLSRLEADRAVFSIFGEYQKKLIEDYHIFALEGSYGTGTFREDNLIGRMHYYGTGNTEYEIKGIQYLTDDSGQAFREQVLAYMEQASGVSFIRDFTGMAAQWEEQSIQGQELTEQEEGALDEFRELKNSVENGQYEEDGSAEDGTIQEQVQDPFASFEQIEKSGLLSLVLPEEMEVSGLRISPEEQVSRRTLRTGRGTFPMRKEINGIEERILFLEYILDQFQNAESDAADQGIASGESEDQERSLMYETEYIIAGKETDKENLESVLTKLFFIRTALNYTSLLNDSSRQSEAAALATVLSAAVLMPELAEGLKQLVLVVWAAGESVVDIRTLLSGRRTPLVKSQDNWQLPLSGLLTLGSSAEQLSAVDHEDGISYQEYLKVLLFMEDQNEVTMRTLDRIEENMNTVHGMDFFQADQCVSKIEFVSTAVLFEQISYTFPVYFGYE